MTLHNILDVYAFAEISGGVYVGDGAESGQNLPHPAHHLTAYVGRVLLR